MLGMTRGHNIAAIYPDKCMVNNHIITSLASPKFIWVLPFISISRLYFILHHNYNYLIFLSAHEPIHWLFCNIIVMISLWCLPALELDYNVYHLPNRFFLALRKKLQSFYPRHHPCAQMWHKKSLQKQGPPKRETWQQGGDMEFLSVLWENDARPWW